jgi:hypothetical protein
MLNKPLKLIQLPINLKLIMQYYQQLFKITQQTISQERNYLIKNFNLEIK